MRPKKCCNLLLGRLALGRQKYQLRQVLVRGF